MKPINLAEPMPAQVAFHQVSQWSLWMLAFRPFFLAGGSLACLSVGYWLLPFISLGGSRSSIRTNHCP